MSNHNASSEQVRPRVVVIYHMFPHYRAPIVRELAKSQRFRFDFYGSHEPIAGIKPFQGDESVTVHPLSFCPVGSGGVFKGYLAPLLHADTDAVVLIGNPNFLQTWTAAAVARLRGKAVLFWTHGWLKRESTPRRVMRNTYFALAHRVMVYGDRARILAKTFGFKPDTVRPIYNSLDWDCSVPLFDALQQTSVEQVRTDLGLPLDLPVLVCTARLSKLCRFDLLIEAANKLKNDGRPTKIVLIGDGPERAALEAQAAESGVDVLFTGAIYDEQELSKYIYSADLTVSPGKIGLTAMHSLTYGTPVVTHGDLDHQMPEVEAIVSGRTGEFFQRGDVDDLARAIRTMLQTSYSRAAVRDACREIMIARYTPWAQRLLIEDAVAEALSSVGKTGRKVEDASR